MWLLTCFIEFSRPFEAETERRLGCELQVWRSSDRSPCDGMLSGVSDFEYTQETTVFDMLDIALYHAWIVPPEAG